MKNKLLSGITLLLVCLSTLTFAQDKEKAKSEKAITWYGIDFTLAKFTLVTEDPSTIVNQYMKSINSLIQTEQEKFNLKKFFHKDEVNYDLDQVNEFNAGIKPDGLVTGDEHKITADDAKKALAKYKTQGKQGLGLIFIAENLNKTKQTGSYYVCFFNQDTKEVVDMQYADAKAVGIGFRNYWAGSVYNVMKGWLK